MTPSAIHTAAQQLLDALRAGVPGPRLPESCRPQNVAEGLLVQRRITGLRELAGERIGGWKCSLPSSDKVIVAPIFASAIRADSPCPIPVRGGVAGIEPEIAFVMGRDLPPRGSPYTEAEVRAAVAETRLVLELMGCRYADPAALPFAEMLADSANHFGLFRGPAVAGGVERIPDSFPLAIDGGGRNYFRGTGRHGDGHPLRPLVWLANFLGAESGWNTGLRAGEIITTGSYAGRAVDVPPATPLTISFGDLGSIGVTLVAA